MTPENKVTPEKKCSHISDCPPIENRPLKGDERVLVEAMLISLKKPDLAVDTVVTGPNFTGVSAGGRMGLASFLGARPRSGEEGLAQSMVGKPVLQAAGLVRSESPWAISLGFAALNAANAPDPAKVVPNDFPADTLIADMGKNRVVGLVGEFPFVETLADRVGTLHLFELRPVPNALPRQQWETMLPRLDVLAITGTALLTRKMAWYLSRATRAKIVILGPTTPVSNALFDFGADFLCGSVVTDPDRVAANIQAGLSFKEIKKKGGIIFTQWEKKDMP